MNRQTLVLVSVALAVCFVLVWLYRQPRFEHSPAQFTIVEAFGWLLLVAAAAAFFWFVWWKTGRFKWFLLGIATIKSVNYWQSENALLCIALALFILYWRDEVLRERLIEQAKDEAREDADPRSWIGYRGQFEPEPLSNEEESTMHRLARRILEKL